MSTHSIHSPASQLDRSHVGSHGPASRRRYRRVADNFESLLVERMLDTMSSVKLGPSVSDRFAGSSWMRLYHQKIAQVITRKDNLGLAHTIMRELDPALKSTPRARPSNTTLRPSINHRKSASAPTSAGLYSAQTSPKGGQKVRFLEKILPGARHAAQHIGVSPRAVAAQAALETGWGRHVPGNNLFGIKHHSGAGVHAGTIEYRGHTAYHTTADFQRYSSLVKSLQDYTRLITQTPRYKHVMNHGDNIEGFAHALVKSGYATDPNYAQKIIDIAHSPVMDHLMRQASAK